jgi:ketosteroid isomerase-like protein
LLLEGSLIWEFDMNMNRRKLAFAGAVAAGAALLNVGLSTNAMACDTDDVLKAIEEYRKAMVDGNGARLLELSSDNMSFGHATGAVQTKVEFVKTVVDKVEIFHAIKLYDHNIQVNGDQAIARHTFDAKITWNNKDLDLVLGVLQVWRKEEGRWRLFARQTFKPLT